MTPLPEPTSRRRLWLVAAPTALALTLAGCAAGTQSAAPATTPEATSEAEPAVDTALDGFSTAADVLAGNQEAHDDPADAEWSQADAATIDLDGSTASSASADVDIAGSTVTISAAGTYLRYFEVFFITGCIYLVLTISITRLLRLVEKKMDGKNHYTIYGSQSDSKSSITVESKKEA